MTTHIDAGLKEVVDAIAAATGARSSLTTTDKSTFAAAINEIKAAVDVLGTVEHEAADVAARDALTGLVAGDRVFVTDASADATVDAGWAIYRWDGAAFLKMAEQESLDVAIAANLSAGTVDATSVEIAIDSGTNVTLNGATTTNAGLMVAADKSAHDEHVQEVSTVQGENYATYVNGLM